MGKVLDYASLAFQRRVRMPASEHIDRQYQLILGRRSDPYGGPNNSQPQTLFELDTVAELQEYQRLFSAYQKSVNDQIALLGKQYKIRMLVLSVTSVTAIAVATGWALNRGPMDVLSTSQSQLASVSPPAVVREVAVSAPSVTAIVASPPEAAASSAAQNSQEASTQSTSEATPVPQSVLQSRTSNASPGSVPAANLTDSAVEAPLPAKAVASAAPVNTPSKAVTAVTKSSPVTVKSKETTATLPRSVDEPLAAATPQPKNKAGAVSPPEDKVFVLESPIDPRETKPSVRSIEPVENKPLSVAPSAVKNIAPLSAKPVDAPAPKEVGDKSNGKPKDSVGQARQERFSSQGVVTLTAGGVVVFDREKRQQRMVAIGGVLPDGSVVKGIDLKESKVRTDRGDVVYD